MNTNRLALSFFMVLLGISIFAATAAADSIRIDRVYLNGLKLSEGGTTRISNFMEGNSIVLNVHVDSIDSLSSVKIEAQLTGDSGKTSIDRTNSFSMKANVTSIKTLYLTLPDSPDNEKYRLTVFAQDSSKGSDQAEFTVQIESPSKDVEIRQILVNLENNEVQAGRTVPVSVRVKNSGDRAEEDIKVMVSIPALGITASDFIERLDADETTTTRQMSLRLPRCVAPGFYEIEAVANFDNFDYSETKSESFRITENPACNPAYNPFIGYDGNQVNGGASYPSDNYPSSNYPSNNYPSTNYPTGTTGQSAGVTISVPPSGDATAGAGGAVYPITISNPSATAETFSFTVDGIGWGSYSFEPTNIITIGAKGTGTTYLYVAADRAAAPGNYNFALMLTNRGSTSSIPLEANIIAGQLPAGTGSTGTPATGTTGAAGSSGSAIVDIMKKVLEISLIVLVVLLVVTGVYIAYRKIKHSEDSAESASGIKEKQAAPENKPVYY